jgi:Transcriptional regulator containing PAS, AAA-type ATPase, and DNA-binding domains
MAIDGLELQLVSAVQRFGTLQRRADAEPGSGKLFARSMKELEGALELLRVAQAQLLENRERVEQLQHDLGREREKYGLLLDQMSQPYVVTQADSKIIEANRAAAELFNVSQRFLVGKLMSVFVCENRSTFLVDIATLAKQPRTTELAFKLRPRERAPVEIAARVSTDGRSLRWVLNPAPPTEL